MSKTNTIHVGSYDGFAWIRCEGKGSFMNSPQMKKWGEAQIEAGVHVVVIDLESCTGMDSTFMGTMAGLAMRLMKMPGGSLQVADAGEKNRRSLEDLGLASLIQIEPVDAAWVNDLGRIREGLSSGEKESPSDRTQHVYDAHKQLVDVDDRNNEKFSTVLDCLEAELASRKPSK